MLELLRSIGQSRITNFSLYDLIAYRTKTPAQMAANTFLTVNFSFTDGGGSGKFDMILPIALVKVQNVARIGTD
jgi:hypothetical protein